MYYKSLSVGLLRARVAQYVQPMDDGAFPRDQVEIMFRAQLLFRLILCSCSVQEKKVIEKLFALDVVKVVAIITVGRTTSRLRSSE